jgi:hypothetical protein
MSAPQDFDIDTAAEDFAGPGRKIEKRVSGGDLILVQRTNAWKALKVLLPSDCDYVWRFNDSHTHAEVVVLFQRAIRAEKAKEGVALDVEVEVPA